jgi:TrpR-related protein YerC/YecD
MPKVARKLTDKKKIDQFCDDFLDAIALLNSKEDARGFFNDLLTHTERIMLAKRFQVAVMLIEGHDYQTIRNSVEVANSTITRVNVWLKTGATSLFKVVQRFLDDVGPYLKKAGASGDRRYIAGDLLTPAIDEGARIIATKLAKRGRKRPVKK